MDPDPGSTVFFISVALLFVLALAVVYLSIKLAKYKHNTEPTSMEEIQSLVEAGREHGIIDEIDQERIKSLMDFDDITAREVMTPRTEVFAIDASEPIGEYLDEMLEVRFTRIPVYNEEIDHIIGILFMKDFIVEARRVGFENVDITSIIHPAYFVPESKNIDELFRSMQAEKRQIAVLIDEYGGFSGIVTLEDVIEEIMGDISDEHDPDEQPEIIFEPDGSFVVCGWVTIDDLNAELKINLDEESPDYDTVGGLVTTLLGYIPDEKEHPQTEFEGLRFYVEQALENRIEKVRITKLLPDEQNKNTQTDGK
ncbi:MAG: hemolysin family protein [Clostridia bacterium]|nr:hemolysin family protein [Clostridia bacterium]